MQPKTLSSLLKADGNFRWQPISFDNRENGQVSKATHGQITLLSNGVLEKYPYLHHEGNCKLWRVVEEEGTQEVITKFVNSYESLSDSSEKQSAISLTQAWLQ